MGQGDLDEPVGDLYGTGLGIQNPFLSSRAYAALQVRQKTGKINDVAVAEGFSVQS